MAEIPFNILVFYVSIAMTIGILGIMLGLKRVAGSPFMTVFAGIMFMGLIAITQDVTIAYIEDVNYTRDYIMNVTSGATTIQLANANFGAGERPVNINSQLYNSSISCIMMDLSKTGAPTGTANIGIMGGAGTIIKSFGTIDVTTLTTSQKSYTFCLPNHDYWIVSLYDRMGILYTTGTAGNGVNVYLDGTNPYDGSNSDRSTLSSGFTWTDVSNSDLRMIITFDNANIEAQAVNYAFNQNDIWVFMAVLSFFFTFMGVMLQWSKWSK